MDKKLESDLIELISGNIKIEQFLEDYPTVKTQDVLEFFLSFFAPSQLPVGDVLRIVRKKMEGNGEFSKDPRFDLPKCFENALSERQYIHPEKFIETVACDEKGNSSYFELLYLLILMTDFLLETARWGRDVLEGKKSNLMN